MRSSSRPMRLRRSPKDSRARSSMWFPAEIPEFPVLGIHMDAEIHDVAAQPLDVLARDAVQVKHDANDDGRRNPLE